MDNKEPDKWAIYEVDFVSKRDFRYTVRRVDALNHAAARKYVEENNSVHRIVRSVHRKPVP